MVRFEQPVDVLGCVPGAEPHAEAPAARVTVGRLAAMPTAEILAGSMSSDTIGLLRCGRLRAFPERVGGPDVVAAHRVEITAVHVVQRRGGARVGESHRGEVESAGVSGEAQRQAVDATGAESVTETPDCP
ncbi:hypothetical protein [Amycolatopsis sp. FDAARGOS 1241]|uniref:hypothetical protein n=1 Tax=Amycolatopsis sp. FDAARGOS 1241 TaxID=2778070 RepID=UPI00194E8F9E|nr:hypothetical protein [Amycolatopsis sp. FDAARGOS 1241]QRP48694.1 hypothetical protein I6J71_13235 [Amycolatopsis sp. FDAARGOS 1241]